MLAEALNDPYYMLDAAIVLGELGERSAVSAMTGALRDESYVVREKAAEALGRLEDRSAVPALIEALKDETDSVRERVVSAIGRLCDRSSIPALIEALSSFSHPVDVLAALRFVCAKPDEVKLSQMKDKLKEHSAFEWNERGSRLITSGEFWEALRCFEKATEIDPDWEVPRKNWADLEEHTFTPPKRDGDSCTSPLEPPPFAELILESEMKGEMKRTYDLLKDLIKIGRSPDPDKRPEASEDEKGLRNDILVPDETVSRWHGAIRKVKDEYEYEDHSFNGTIICGIKLIKGGKIKLSHGDKIIISETRFRFLNRNDPTFYKILTDWNKGPCPGRRRLFGL